MPNDTPRTETTYNFSFQGKLFAELIRSNFGDFVREVVHFYHQHSEIGYLIRRDQISAALASQHERSRRANDELLASLPLEGIEDADLIDCSLELKTGRPRMDALVVFVFLMLRGREGGPCRASARELALESRSLEAALSGYMSKLPGGREAICRIRGFLRTLVSRYICQVIPTFAQRAGNWAGIISPALQIH